MILVPLDKEMVREARSNPQLFLMDYGDKVHPAYICAVCFVGISDQEFRELADLSLGEFEDLRAGILEKRVTRKCIKWISEEIDLVNKSYRSTRERNLWLSRILKYRINTLKQLRSQLDRLQGISDNRKIFTHKSKRGDSIQLATRLYKKAEVFQREDIEDDLALIGVSWRYFRDSVLHSDDYKLSQIKRGIWMVEPRR